MTVSNTAVAPSNTRTRVSFDTARTTPRSAAAIAVAVFTDGPVGRQVALSRATLESLGFEAKVGQTLVIPSSGTGTGSTVIAVGMGARADVTAATVRTSAAAMARAAHKRPMVATALADAAAEASRLSARDAAQAVVEGVVLASYRFVAHKADKTVPMLTRVTLTASSERMTAIEAGIARGEATAGAVCLARDLANTPPAHLNARDIAAVAEEVGRAAGLDVEVFDEHDLAEMACGGILGVNRGSAEPPRLVKLTYTPRGGGKGHVALVGKGVMYDSGGISLKPSDASHASMKMDMTGAAVVLAAMTALQVTKPKVKVTGYLCCTDNMPSGSALKLGDVLTFRNGKTAEIHNTDAEGRLVLADGLSLAAEENPDAMVDIATLTGACMVALGAKVAGVLGNSDAWVDQLRAASDRADEKIWPLPLVPEYRKLLDSEVADMKNVGGPYGGAITAGLFLQEFVGEIPWAHLDIAGPMRVDGDEGWYSKGATAFGARLLIELVDRFEPPNKR